MSDASRSGRWRVPTFAALSQRDFRLLWGGLLISNIGTNMQTFGLGWYVVQLAIRDGAPQLAPLYLGLLAVSRTVPGLLVGLVAGTVSDSVDRRRLLIVTQSLTGLVAVALAVLTRGDHANLPLLMALSALSAAPSAFESSTRGAMVPGLVPGYSLASAVGLVQVTQTTATLAGPLLGGVLVTFTGVSGLFAFNALSYLAIIGALIAMRPGAAIVRERRQNMLSAIREGYAYVWRDPVIRPLFVLMAVVALAGRSFQQLLPAFAHDALHVGVVELSWLYGAGGAGALLGSMIAASFGDTSWRGRVLAGAPLLFGLALAAFALQHTLFPAILLIVLASCAMQIHTGSHVTTYQSRTPNELQGRVIAASSTEVSTFMSLGVLLVGWLGSFTGIGVALTLGGVTVALAGLLVLTFVPQLRDLGREKLTLSLLASAQ